MLGSCSLSTRYDHKIGLCDIGFFEDKTDPVKGSPEEALLWAILNRTYLDLRSSRTQLTFQHHQREALRWILSEGNEPWTFIWICDHLDLDLDRIRAIMLRGSFFV